MLEKVGAKCGGRNQREQLHSWNREPLIVFVFLKNMFEGSGVFNSCVLFCYRLLLPFNNMMLNNLKYADLFLFSLFKCNGLV